MQALGFPAGRTSVRDRLQTDADIHQMHTKNRSSARNCAHGAYMVLRRQRLRTKTAPKPQISPMPSAAMSPECLWKAMIELRNELNTGLFVELKNSEVIPFGIHEISLPALTGDGEFGLDNRTAKPPYCLLGRIEILNLERANERIGARLGWRTRRRPRKQPPIQVSRFYPPIAFGTLVLGKPPSKNLRIKVSRSRRIVSLNLEIDGHRSSPLLSCAISAHSGATGNPSRACGEVSTNLPRAVLALMPQPPSGSA